MTRIKTSPNIDKQIDKILPQDFAIFKKATDNANFFTDYYLRTPTSGTFWKAVPEPLDEERSNVWKAMYDRWIQLGSPKDSVTFSNSQTAKTYKILKDELNRPIFHDHHGWLWMPWQLKVHHCPQPDVTVLGGFGSGKTSEIAMSLLTLAATIPHFRGFAVAPQMLQSMEVYNYIMTWAKGTPYWDRWVVSYPKKPYPRIVIQNSYVGESTIELLSIEHDPEKVRTLEGDIIYLDQAEKFQDLDALTRDLGSRLRGQVHGRARLGKLIFIANAGDNPELWYRYDMAETNPETYLSMTVTSYDNIWLSKRDLESLERRVGGTQEEIAQWMKGIRPIGNGEHFPSSVIKLNLDEGLTNVVQYQTELPEGHPDKKPGFVLKKANRVGIYHWEMPPEKNRVYIVIADPGQSNPPDRNSAIIMVWDVTDFPSQPARLQAFNWVFCNGSYWPFVTAFEDYVKRYNAKGRNGFDSTGTQTGFNELVFATMSLETEGINLAAQGKYLALNAAKFFMGRGMMKIPYIEHLVNQLSHYRLPDAKLKQDLVMCIAMSAAYMRRYYYEDMPDIEGLVKPSSKQQTYDRHIRGVSNRYERTTR